MKRGRPKLPPRQPSVEQETWLRENFRLYNRDFLAEKLGIHTKLLRQWCNQLGLKKKVIRARKPKYTPPKQIIRFVPEREQSRPPAKYSNITREQHVQRWLSVNI